MTGKFLIVFKTETIAPLALPPFPYQATAIEFDRVTYKAVAFAESEAGLVEMIHRHWPTATVSTIEPFEQTLIATPSIVTPLLGTIPAAPPPHYPGVFRRIHRWAWGDPKQED